MLNNISGEDAILAVRLGIGVVMLAVSLEAWRMAAILHNDRLFILGKKIFYTLLVFGVIRIVAGLVDGWVDFGFAWASTLSTYAFWAVTYSFFFSHRRILQKQATADDRAQISEAFDLIVDKMKIVKVKMDDKLGHISEGCDAK